MSTRTILAGLSFITITSGYSAQLHAQADVASGARERLVPFLEGTDVFWTLPGIVGDVSLDNGSPYLLEADIFPHLIGYQSFTNLLQVDPDEDGGRFGWSISGTPAVRIRMLKDKSNPIRTPSYMPRVNAQVFWATSSTGGVDFLVPGTADPGGLTVHLLEGHVNVGHHSNGQDGCLTQECAPVERHLTPELINRRDGNFSTNYWRIGINYSYNRWLDNRPAQYSQADSERRLKVEFESHFATFDDMAPYYARNRIHLEKAYAKRGVGMCKKRSEWAVSVVRNLGSFEDVPTGSLNIQWSCFLSERGGWGFFVRYYGGQDYYNIGFMDNISRLHVGFTYNQGDFFRALIAN